MNKKLLIALSLLVVVGGGAIALRQNPNEKSQDNAGLSLKKAGGEAGQLPTAKQAWEKVKPKADEWSSDYKIARIKNVDTPSYQRIDGVSLGWEFYLEECQEYYTGKNANSCKEGKSRSFYYQADDLAGRKAGVSADEENPRKSGRKAFSAEDWQIDSDQAQDIAREVLDRERNKNEEFRMEAIVLDGKPYWKVIRQCWTRGDRDNCDSSNGYSAYVDIKTGEATSEKP